jgi:hypothetical protein
VDSNDSLSANPHGNNATNGFKNPQMSLNNLLSKRTRIKSNEI